MHWRQGETKINGIKTEYVSTAGKKDSSKIEREGGGETCYDSLEKEILKISISEGRLRFWRHSYRSNWYGHVQRTGSGYIVQRMLNMELPARKKRERPQRRFMDVMK